MAPWSGAGFEGYSHAVFQADCHTWKRPHLEAPTVNLSKRPQQHGVKSGFFTPFFQPGRKNTRENTTLASPHVHVHYKD
jgi:hypothetical protein